MATRNTLLLVPEPVFSEPKKSEDDEEVATKAAS
jgi:hypothetical protein